MSSHRLAALSGEHSISAFACGEKSIDDYLANEALAAQESGEARTHVWLDGESDAVVGYFTLMPTTVVYNDLPKSIRLGGTKSIPGYLLAKLGLDRSLRGRGLGPDLLLDALATVVRAADAAGGRVIVVDSLPNDKVHRFYCSADFMPLQSSYRLWMKTATARDATR